MGVVELNGRVIREHPPGLAALAEARQDVLQGAADEEVLLEKPQRAAGLCRIVRIENACQ
jgi:hypothetical protein